MNNNPAFIGRDLPPASFGRRSGKGKQFVELLKTRPGEWAVYRITPTRWQAHSVYRGMYPGTDWATRKTNGKNKKWTVYARWVGLNGEFE